MSEIEFRRAHADDIDAIYEIENACFPAPWTRIAFYQDIVENSMARYYVAVSDGKVLAYAGVWYILDEGHITNVAVHPSFRGLSIAENLLNHLFDEAVRNGVVHFTLEVRTGNAAAIRLYTKLGFEAQGIRKGYYIEEKEDALIMWLDKSIANERVVK